MARATETDIAIAIMRIAAGRADGFCSFNRARKEVPNYVQFAAADLVQSVKRPREPMWHQLIRNIRSHHDADGNFIDRGLLAHVPRRGYEITAAGRAYLNKKGL